MEIIKRGIENYDPTYVSKCPFCGTVFSYKWDEIKDNQVSAWHEYHVNCPNCNHAMAWNKHPLRMEPMQCDSSIIVKLDNTYLIPDGARAFSIRRVGYEIRLTEIDTIIPAMMPTLIIGTFEEINEVAGLGSELPSGEKGEKIQLDEYSGNKLMIITPDFKLRLMNSSDKSKYGIIPTQVTLLSPVRVVELSTQG